MRRKEREKDAAFAFRVLRDCDYATLATLNADGTPYCIPISPVSINNFIYFHCAAEGKKLDNINQNNAVCVSCVSRVKPVPEKFTTEFESAVIAGKCEMVPDEAEKIMALRALCEKYASSNMDGFDAAIARNLHRTCVYKVHITQITGKANNMAPAPQAPPAG